MKKSLFEESDLVGGQSVSKSEPGRESTFQINEKYAKKYEAEKRAAELRALEEKYAQKYKQYIQEGDRASKGGSSEEASGEDDSGSSSSDESDVVEDEQGASWLAQTVDKALLNVIKEVRNKSKTVYEDKREFFEKEKLREQAEAWHQARAGGPEEGLSLAQYHHQLLKNDFYAKSEDNNIAVVEGLPYEKEQERLKAEMRAVFHDAVDVAEAETEDFFKVSKKTEEEQVGEEKELAAMAAELFVKEGMDTEKEKGQVYRDCGN
jgi:hypothetical protein